MTQEERTLDYLRTFGSITALEAMEELGVVQLPARILHLRRRGHAIDTCRVQGKNRFGETITYGVYRLAEDRSPAQNAAMDRAARESSSYDEQKELALQYLVLERMAREVI